MVIQSGAQGKKQKGQVGAQVDKGTEEQVE